MVVGRGCRCWVVGWVMVVLVGEGVAAKDLVGLRFISEHYKEMLATSL